MVGQGAIQENIGEGRWNLLERNVEYHLSVSDVAERDGEDVPLGKWLLAVTIERGGAGYAMEVHISIGENHRFELREALLVCGDRQRSFVTRHPVTLQKDGPPALEPAQPLTLGFVESLVRSLWGGSTAEVLSENVLAK